MLRKMGALSNLSYPGSLNAILLLSVCFLCVCVFGGGAFFLSSGMLLITSHLGAFAVLPLFFPLP